MKIIINNGNLSFAIKQYYFKDKVLIYAEDPSLQINISFDINSIIYSGETFQIKAKRNVEISNKTIWLGDYSTSYGMKVLSGTTGTSGTEVGILNTDEEQYFICMAQKDITKFKFRINAGNYVNSGYVFTTIFK